ncbi:MAG: response regulator transcription factor [Cyclobacteriaceae bacterium]|nr:response regulator transcription factor [Cyclobacteriaceae bacterium HetDA_MAG_MS6]
MSKPKLLIVEDDPNLGQILSEYLSLKGFDTLLKIDGEVGLRAFLEEPFDLCILDLMMPKKDGFTLAKEIREINNNIPIIFLTAKSMKEDVILGFKVGADDYITKPFSMEELLMRINAVLKRTKKEEQAPPFPSEFVLGGFRYYHEENRLNTPDEEIKLTTKENELLKIFLENLNKTVSRSIALKKIWKDDSYFNARSMDVYIAKLRKYLRADESIKIVTVHGEGFKLVHLN